MLKSKGPRIDSCGTPNRTSSQKAIRRINFSSVITVSQITVSKSQSKNAESIRMQFARKIHAKGNLKR